jgi:hypothetical protein
VGVVLSLIYFAVVPTISSAVVAACLGWAAWLVKPASNRILKS